jgi:hypothetical protein
MPYPPITPLPAVPNRSAEPEIFSDAVDAFLTALPTLQGQINAAGTYIQGVGAQVDSDKTTTGGHVTAAAGSASAAASSQALAAASADFKGAWPSLTGALNKPASVSHNGSFWALLNNLANVTTSTPSLTNTDWQFISGTRWQATRTANFTIANNAFENVTATSGVVVATLPTLVANNFICVANNPDSTQLVRISKSGVAVRSNTGTVASGDDITLRPGQVFYAYAINSTNLRVPKNG